MAKVVPITQLPPSLQEVLDMSRDGKFSQQTPRHFPNERTPTIVTTQQHENDPFANTTAPYIECWVNPAVMNWSAPLREVLQKTKGGSIRYRWPRNIGGKDRRYYDELTVGITFQTGSILTRTLGEFEGEVPNGLAHFYMFLRLLNEPGLLEDGSENYHIVQHNSPVFPSITLKGWFQPEGVTWPETATDGYSLQWTATMEVHKTVPSIWDAAGLERMFGTTGY